MAEHINIMYNSARGSLVIVWIFGLQVGQEQVGPSTRVSVEWHQEVGVDRYSS